MCKAMMEQRYEIEAKINESLEICLEDIRQKGDYHAPAVMLDREKLFIANREYFERQGFFFEPENKIVNGKVCYFAWMKLGGEGELAKQCWKKIREAQEFFMKAQRKKIFEQLRENEIGSIMVDMKELLFENKLFFEEHGYCFDSAIRFENGEVHYFAYMKKRK